MAHGFDVLAVGDYCLDLIFTGLPGMPEIGREVVGKGFEMTPGGGYNAVAALHRLGVRVGWAADFGNDEFSRFVLERAAAEGIDSSLFVHHPRPLRNVTACASYPLERAFLTYYDPPPAVPAGAQALAAVRARAIYVPGIYTGPLMGAARRILRARQMTLFMDGNSGEGERLDIPAVRQAIRSTDIFMPNAAEACRMAGTHDLHQALLAIGKYAPLVIGKDGPGGAYACRDNVIIHSPALPVRPYDTTGAGDCFNAGFIKAWLDGRPLSECLRWGNIVGGLSTLAAGGTGERVTVADVERYLRLPA